MGNPRSEGFVATVVAVLAEERQRQGMSHERLAEAAGVHRSTVSRIERGLMNPTLYVVHSIAEALGIQLTDAIAKASEQTKLSPEHRGTRRSR